MNRRHFIKCGMAAGVAIALGRKVTRAAGFTQTRTYLVSGLGDEKSGRIPRRGDPYPRPPIDVTGKPTPDWLPCGEPLKTYFKAGTPEIPRDIRCFLNGVEVTGAASECDTQGGWVRMYERNPNCPYLFLVTNEIPVERIHFGKVEIR